LGARADHHIVDKPLHFVSIYIDYDGEVTIICEVLVVAGVVFVVVAVACVESDHVVVDLVERTVHVVCVEDSEGQATVVKIVDGHYFEVELLDARGEHCVLPVEFVPVVDVVLLELCIDQVPLVRPVQLVEFFCGHVFLAVLHFVGVAERLNLGFEVARHALVLVDLSVVLEDENGREAGECKLVFGPLALVSVNLCENSLVLQFVSKLSELRFESDARSAPRGLQVDDHQLLGLFQQFLEFLKRLGL